MIVSDGVRETPAAHPPEFRSRALDLLGSVDGTGDDDRHVIAETTTPTQETLAVHMTGDLAEPVAAVAGLAQLGTGGRKSRDVATHARTEAENGSNSKPEVQNKIPGQLVAAEGFNLTNLAEPVGFEP